MSSIPITSPALLWRESRNAWIWLAAAALAMVVIFNHGIAELWRSWMERPEYGFGVFIPFITAFLVWQRKDRLARVTDGGSYAGLGLIAIGVLLRFAGDVAVATIFVEYGMLVALFGIVLCHLGRQGLRIVAVPLGFLVFMCPLPEFLLQSLSERLQLLSSVIGVWLIRAFDISVYLQGNIIDLGSMKLQVAEACSGLRYLFSLMTIGFIAAYFFKGRWWKKATIFVSAVPITVFMNSLRIGLVGVTVEYWGRSAAEGMLHEFEGMVIFIGCTLILLAEMWLLARVGRERLTLRSAFGLDFPSRAPSNAGIRYRVATPPLRAAVLLLAVAACVAVLEPRPAAHPPAREMFNEFPMTVADYRGEPRALDQIYLDVLKADDYLLADYTGRDGLPVNLYIQYYARQDRTAATHSPRLCIPAGGWDIDSLRRVSVAQVSFRGKPLEVNRAVISHGTTTLLVYYWFQQRGRDTTNEYLTKLLIFWDALTKHRSDGSMVRIMTPIRAGEEAAAGDARLARFAGVLQPALGPFIPG